MLRYPAMIPEAPKINKNQGSASNHSSSQLPIKNPMTTESPSSIPMELNMTHLVFLVGHCMIIKIKLNGADYSDPFHFT